VRLLVSSIEVEIDAVGCALRSQNEDLVVGFKCLIE
jgi:hypothetical protein